MQMTDLKMLTQDEAVQFCEQKLGVKDALSSKQRSALEFLNKIIKAFHLTIPFQNITLLAEAVGNPGVPSVQEIKASVLDGFGGLCFTNNVFMKHLLEALGYCVDSVASCCNPAHPNNHILSIVHNLLIPGDRYLVDVGCGYPTYEAIPLDFQEGSPMYSSSFLTYKFLCKGDGVYERHHLQDFRAPQERKSQEWKWFYDFSLTPRTVDYFTSAMTEVYCDRFLKKIRVLQFTEDTMLALKEDNITGGAIYMEISPGKTESECVSDDKAIVGKISNLFCNAKWDTIVSAVQHWRCTKGRNGKSSQIDGACGM